MADAVNYQKVFQSCFLTGSPKYLSKLHKKKASEETFK